jgi:PAS domain S-box-containing protein
MGDSLIDIMGLGEFSSKKSYYMELEREKIQILKTQSLLNSVIDSMPSVIIGIDLSYSIIMWNSLAREKYRISENEALGRSPFSVCNELNSIKDEIEHSLKELKILGKKKVRFQEQTQVMYYDITVYPVKNKDFSGAVIRIDDVTEQVKIEELLIQSEKMLSVGGLAAGMAHEINNPLASIVQNSQNLSRRLFEDNPKNSQIISSIGLNRNLMLEYFKLRNIDAIIQDISNSVIRASKIVSNMLSFARKGDNNFSLASLSSILDNTFLLAESDYDLKKDFDFKSIRIIKDYTSAGIISCDISKIQQVLYNIIKNGTEAMENLVDPVFIFRIYEKDKWVICEIQDNGGGITEDIKKRIFEPFFSTKEVGKGTGLGMSVSYFIVTKLHGGELSVESVEGQWTRFIVKLPRKVK